MTPMNKPRMSDQWVRNMAPRRRHSAVDVLAGALVALAVVAVVIITAAALARGVADAEVSIETGPEGME